MKLVMMYQVPEGTQIILRDLGYLGTRISANNLDQDVGVDIELDGGLLSGGTKRIVRTTGKSSVFVDDSIVLLTGQPLEE